jgi:hypothetical protein
MSIMLMYGYHEDKGDWSDVAERTKVEFEVMKHSNFTVLTVFQHKTTLVRVGVYILALH